MQNPRERHSAHKKSKMFGSSQSPLTQALNSVKNEQQVLTSQRKYLAIRALRNRCIEEVAELKKLEAAEIRKEQAIERERLEKAKDVMRVKTHAEAQHKVQEIAHRFQATAELHAARQARHLEQYEAQVRAAESKRPLVYSTTIRDLLAAEEHLVKLGLYEDAEFAKRKIGSAAQAEKRKFREEQEQRIQTRLRMRKAVLEDAADYMQAKCKNEISMAAHRAAEAERLLDEKFRHSAEDMSHAHRLELCRNPLLLNLQCPPSMTRKKALASRSNAAGSQKSAGLSNVMATKGSRGTQLLQTAVGSRYEVPSLCDSYGSLIESPALPHCALRSYRPDPPAAAPSHSSDAGALFDAGFGANSNTNSARKARAATAPMMPTAAARMSSLRYGLVGAADAEATYVY